MCAATIDRIDIYQFNRYASKEVIPQICSEISLRYWRKVERFGFQAPGEEMRYSVIVDNVVVVDDDGEEEEFLAKDVSAAEYEALNSDLLLYGLNWTEIEGPENTAGTPVVSQCLRYRSGRDWDKAPVQAAAIERRYRIFKPDARRARHSADLLAAIFHCPAFPFVVGCHIDPATQALAKSIDVRSILIPDEPYFQLDYRYNPVVQ